MLKLILRLIYLLRVQSEKELKQRQKSLSGSREDQFNQTLTSLFKYKDQSIFNKRKYIGPLFENKTNSMQHNHAEQTTQEYNKQAQVQSPLRFEVKRNKNQERSVIVRSNENTALNINDMLNQEFDFDRILKERPKKVIGPNWTVVVFIILLISVGNLFPAAFRGVKFFFVAIILFFISLFITSKFKK